MLCLIFIISRYIKRYPQTPTLLKVYYIFWPDSVLDIDAQLARSVKPDSPTRALSTSGKTIRLTSDENSECFNEKLNS